MEGTSSKKGTMIDPENVNLNNGLKEMEFIKKNRSFFLELFLIIFFRIFITYG